MKKPLKVTIVITVSIITALSVVLLGFHFFRQKGQAREEIIVQPANNTVLEPDESVLIAQCSPTESLFYLAGNLKNFQSYYATITGEVSAGGIYKQKVAGEKYIVGEKSLYITTATSSLKKLAMQIYMENDAVLLRNGNVDTGVYENETESYTYLDYLQEYGTDYRNLSNYVLNENTILRATLVSAQDGLYTYEYEINLETGVNPYRVNMYKMGNLNSLPTMHKCVLTVVMTENFMPVSIRHYDEYSVDMFITLNCKSTLIETFPKINDDSITIPELEFFQENMPTI